MFSKKKKKGKPENSGNAEVANPESTLRDSDANMNNTDAEVNEASGIEETNESNNLNINEKNGNETETETENGNKTEQTAEFQTEHPDVDSDGTQNADDDTSTGEEKPEVGIEFGAGSESGAGTESELTHGREEDKSEPTELEKAYCLGAGIDPETLSVAKTKLAEIAEAVNKEEFNPGLIQTALKLIHHERLIEEARSQGRREAEADLDAEALRNKRKKALEAASIPVLHGTKGLGSPFNGDSIFDIARRAAK